MDTVGGEYLPWWIVMAAKGGRVGSTPEFNLHFVNMNVSSQTERLRNQKIIRSTAMSSFRSPAAVATNTRK
jgi:hypothetical protein